MVVLQTLGTAEIRIRDRVLLPTAAHAFAATLYLGEMHGREVRRVDLQALLFPEREPVGAGHSLRQLLYRLRRMGVPVKTRGDVVVLPSDQVELDHEVMASDERLAGDVAAILGRGVLPAYTPTVSEAFARWVDDRRAGIHTSLLQYLVAQLAALRARGRLHDVEPIAKGIRALDPLNEEAVLALAEVLALRGQKAEAVRLLDGYLVEMAPYGADLRVQAKVLRGRISEHTSERRYRRLAQGPFVGREDEMADLWQKYQRSRLGEGCAVVLHGEPGVGKTRLASEFLMAARLDGATCLRVECAAHDVERPLSVFTDLVPKLLDAPGGLGVAPSALTYLRRLTQAPTESTPRLTGVRPQLIFAQILEAIRDLMSAVSEEAPVAVLVDDAHSMDEASFNAIVDFSGRHGDHRVIFLLTSRRKLLPESHVARTDRLSWLRIGPLEPSDAAALLRALDQERHKDDEADRQPPDLSAMLEMAAGNPLYLRWLVTEGSSDDAHPSSPSLQGLLLQRIQRLSSSELRAFVAAVTLGRHCELDRLVQTAGLTEQQLLGAVQTLEQQGYLSADGTEIRSSHPLLSEIAMKELPTLTLQLVREKAAGLLEAAAIPRNNVTMLWDAAECWHLSGSTQHAIDLLSSCAAHCVGIGQPANSCKLLNRAIELAQPSPDPSLRAALIEAATLAEDYSLVLSAINEARLARSAQPKVSIHDDWEHLELRAIRLNGTALPDLLPRLEQCFYSTAASPTHRLAAAPTLLTTYEMLLDANSAQRAATALQFLPRTTAEDQLYYNRALFHYHAFAGDARDGLDACNRALSLINEHFQAPSFTMTRIAIGLSLFRFGEAALSSKVLQVAHASALQAGMLSVAQFAASGLVWLYFFVGDTSGRQQYEQIADDLYDSNDLNPVLTSLYLSNKIEHALWNGDAEEASYWLERAEGQYTEIQAPASMHLRHAYQLRIAQIGGHRNAQTPTLDAIAHEHQIGCTFGMRDDIVEAYWHELDQFRGRAIADGMLHQYLTQERRDGFPVAPGLGRVVQLQKR